jgi:hypothetical protein
MTPPRDPSLPPLGRPRKIQTPEELDERVDTYLAHCAEVSEPVTFFGMILALGFVSADALDEYSNYSTAFSESVKRARALISASYERRLDRDKSGPVIGGIFALKNLAGWTDKREIEWRGISASIILDRLTDAQLERVKQGEHPLAVLAEGSALTAAPIPPGTAPLALLPPPVPDPTPSAPLPVDPPRRSRGRKGPHPPTKPTRKTPPPKGPRRAR